MGNRAVAGYCDDLGLQIAAKQGRKLESGRFSLG